MDLQAGYPESDEAKVQETLREMTTEACLLVLLLGFLGAFFVFGFSGVYLQGLYRVSALNPKP